MAWYSILPTLIAQAGAAPDAAPTGGELSVALKLALAIGVIASSFVFGSLIARWLRMPEYSFKIGLVLFTLFAGMAINIAGWPPKRGIDLSGGVVLIYEVDKGAQPSSIQAAIGQLNEKLNAVGAGERLEAKPNAKNQIEIAVPEGVNPQRVERAVKEVESEDLHLTSAGKRSEAGVTVFVYDLDRQQQRVDMAKLIAAVNKRINPGGVKELTIRQYGAEQLEVIIPEIEESEVEHIKKLISTSGVLEFRIVANATDDKDTIRAAAKSSARDVYIGGVLRGRWVKAGAELRLGDEAQGLFRETPGGGREVLVRIDPNHVDGRYLRRAAPGSDQQGRLAVDFTFNAEGGEKFGRLTSKNLPDQATGFRRHLGIVLDNMMLSAPTIESTIHEHGIIQGTFTQDEIDFLVGVLNAGSLPATLNPEPISQQRVSAQLGNDTIYKGGMAIVVSTIAILIFMLVYYRFCGLVADVAVVLNMVVTVALMIMIHAAFTLPGLAGLVLTVGMAVDANVLIYERMREETARGASLRMAIRNGFSRAMATIVDSHVTTIMSGVVLYIVGTDQIKGFAVTMVIGLFMSLFTAVFVARVIFDIAEKKRWLTQLKMMHIIGHTDIDFIRWRTPAMAVSAIIIVIGLVAAWERGQGLLDIDFTGGSSVQFLFAEGKARDIAEVRDAVATLPDVAVSSVGENKREFKIDTSESDIKTVQETLKEKFGDSLQTYSMSYGEVARIEPPKSATEGGAEGSTQPSEKGPGLTPPAEPKPSEDKAKPPAADDAPPAQPEAKGDNGKSAPAESPSPSAEPKSSSRARPSQTIQLASAGADQALAALVIAQAQEAENAAPADKKAETEPPATESDKPAAEQPAPESPGQADAKSKSADAPPKEETQPDVPGSLVGGSRVTLSFPQKISHAPLSDMVSGELAKLKLGDAPFELTNPKYQAGSDVPYAEWTLEIKLDADQTKALAEAIKTRLASTPVFPSSNQIGGKVAADTQLIALWALLASMAIIVVYIWFRFENLIFGLAAVLALVHDVLVTIAFLALSSYLAPYLGFLMVDPFKISLAVVAALLTIVGFSINDTIVVFDRIREVRGKSPDLTEEMINLSVNQTLSRTILTSGTVFIASVILYFIGGPGIHAFAYSMVVGVIAGTYSSIYIAAPVLLWLKKPLVAQQKVVKSTPSGRGVSSERLSKPKGSSPPAA